MEVSNQCKGSIHYRYWILMLTLLIVAIATDRWTGQEGFTDYLSNAATLTSLLLGLAAIIYSFLSNSAISSSLGSINSVANKLDEVKQEISGYVKLAENIEMSGRANVESLEGVSTEMRLGLKEFTSLLAAMGEKNSAMHGMISMLPGKLDDLDSKFSEVASMAKDKPLVNTPDTPKRYLEEVAVNRYFSRSSPVEIFYAYSCIKIWYGNKIIDPKEICKAAGVSAEFHREAESFIRCMDSFGLIEIHDSKSNKENEYVLSRINNYFLENCERLARDAIYEHFKGEDEKENLRVWLDTFKEVDAFYSEKDKAK